MIDYKVLSLEDMSSVLQFEKDILEKSGLSEEEKMMSGWGAPWREEALQHYLPQAWSMSAWKNEELLGYFLAQPFLFFQGKTQVLWVEHVSCEDTEIKNQLIDIAYRMSREKHLQSVLFNEVSKDEAPYVGYKGVKVSSEVLEIPTTKRGVLF